MKDFSQKATPILFLEKDDSRNPTGVEMRVWSLNNGTTLLVRIFSGSKGGYKKLWDGIRTNGEVDQLIFDQLFKNGLLKDPRNWERYSNSEINAFAKQDEFEDAERCHYFAWRVQQNLLRF